MVSDDVNDTNAAGNVTFSRENFALQVLVPRDAEGGQVVRFGASASPSGGAGTNFTQEEFSSSPLEVGLGQDSLVSVVITPELLQVLQDTSNQSETPRLIFLVYEANSPLFQDPVESTTGSVIFSFLRSPEQGPAPINLDSPVSFQFQTNSTVSPVYLHDISSQFMFLLSIILLGVQQQQCAMCFLELHPQW